MIHYSIDSNFSQSHTYTCGYVLTLLKQAAALRAD